MYLLGQFDVIDTTEEDVDRDQQILISFHHLPIVVFCCLKRKEWFTLREEKRLTFLLPVNFQ